MRVCAAVPAARGAEYNKKKAGPPAADFCACFGGPAS